MANALVVNGNDFWESVVSKVVQGIVCSCHRIMTREACYDTEPVLSSFHFRIIGQRIIIMKTPFEICYRPTSQVRAASSVAVTAVTSVITSIVARQIDDDDDDGDVVVASYVVHDDCARNVVDADDSDNGVDDDGDDDDRRGDDYGGNVVQVDDDDYICS